MPANRSYTVYEGGGTVVQMFGDAGGFFRRMAILYPDYMDRSIRHGGYMAQNRLKIEFLQHAPGGKKFPDISPVQRYRALDAFKKRRNRYGKLQPDGSKRLTNFGQRAFLSRGKGLAWGMSGTTWPAGGKLAQAIGYKHERKSMRADVGWLSKSAARIGARFQEGDKTQVTKKVRGLFFAAGIRLSGKQTIVNPPRPVMLPFFQNRSRWILDQVTKRLGQYVSKDAAKETERFVRRKFIPGRGWVAA
jgi:hypothetical protein